MVGRRFTIGACRIFFCCDFHMVLFSARYLKVFNCGGYLQVFSRHTCRVWPPTVACTGTDILGCTVRTWSRRICLVPCQLPFEVFALMF